MVILDVLGVASIVSSIRLEYARCSMLKHPEELAFATPFIVHVGGIAPSLEIPKSNMELLLPFDWPDCP